MMSLGVNIVPCITLSQEQITQAQIPNTLCQSKKEWGKGRGGKGKKGRRKGRGGREIMREKKIEADGGD